jgi:hypothetical protein
MPERLGGCFLRYFFYFNGWFGRKKGPDLVVIELCQLGQKCIRQMIDPRSYTAFSYCQTFDFAIKPASEDSTLVIPQIDLNIFNKWHLC